MGWNLGTSAATMAGPRGGEQFRGRWVGEGKVCFEKKGKQVISCQG